MPFSKLLLSRAPRLSTIPSASGPSIPAHVPLDHSCFDTCLSAISRHLSYSPFHAPNPTTYMPIAHLTSERLMLY